MTTTANNVMITCGGKWVGHVVQLRRAMGQLPAYAGASIFVADRAEVTPAGHFADRSFVVPPITDEGYVDALEAICRNEGVRVLIPLIDVDLLRLAPHRDRFAALGTHLAAPPEELAELCFDKGKFEAMARAEGIRVPRSFSADELDGAPYPLFCKPPRGFGSVGAGICPNRAEAEKVLQSGADVMFQEYVDAPEISVDAYVAADGRCTVRVQRIRDKVVGGEAVQSHTVRLAGVGETAARTIDALSRRGLRGPLNVQVFACGEPAVIEVNPRLGSAVVLSNAACGGRLLRSLLAECCGHSVDGDPEDYDDNLHLYRYLGDMIHNGNGHRMVYP
jgi:carbamoyl-phosphate synthase large subunit